MVEGYRRLVPLVYEAFFWPFGIILDEGDF